MSPDLENRYSRLPWWVEWDARTWRPISVLDGSWAGSAPAEPHPGYVGPPMSKAIHDRAVAWIQGDLAARAILESLWIPAFEWAAHVRAEMEICRSLLRERAQEEAQKEARRREARADAERRRQEWEADAPRRRSAEKLAREQYERREASPMGRFRRAQIESYLGLGFDRQTAASLVRDEYRRMIMRARLAGATSTQVAMKAGISRGRSRPELGRAHRKGSSPPYKAAFAAPQIAVFAEEVRAADRRRKGRAQKMRANAAVLEEKARHLMEMAARASRMADLVTGDGP